MALQRPRTDDAPPPAPWAGSPRASEILFGYDRDPPAVRLPSDEIGWRPLPHPARRRLELDPARADAIMELVAIGSAVALVGAMLARLL